MINITFSIYSTSYKKILQRYFAWYLVILAGNKTCEKNPNPTENVELISLI